MKHPVDDVVAFFSGLTGGSIYAWIAGITWSSFFTSAGQLLWLGIVAMFTGGAGVLGKHMVTKLIKKLKS